MLATQLGLIAALVLLFIQGRRHRELEQRLEDDHGHLYRVMADTDQAQRELRALNEGHHELFKLLKTSVSVDVGGRHDCGWLIFIARVNGQDMVKIQHLKPEMTYQEYQTLLTRLSYDCQHVAYIDASPRYYEQFLRPTPRKGRPW